VIVKKARDINEKALKEKRSMTVEESTNFDAAMDEADVVKAEIDAAVSEERRTSRLSEHEDELNQSRGRRTSTENPGDDPESRGRQTPGVLEYRHGLRFTGGERVLRFAGDATKSEAYNLAARAYLSGGMEGLSRENRAQLADSLKEGGFLVASTQMVAQLIKQADDAVYIRSLATVIQVPTAQSLGAVSLDADMDDAEWTSEVAEAPEDAGLEFGGRELSPKPLSKLVKISRKLIRCSTVPIESLVTERLGYKFNITQEKGFMTGSGVNQPLGLFTASTQGISTGRDVATDNTTTAITGDGLINAKYSLKPQYLADPSCRWAFHRNAIRNIRKLKDLENRYIWQEGLSKDKPDTILEIPYIMSEYVPATFTASQYVGMIGAFRHYMIAEAMGLDIQRLVELYARTNQTGFIGRLEIDGMPALEEAFARVQLAAS
jgi:HK97 family phage major capsid protein